MLTGALVQVRYVKDLVIPRYVDADNRALLDEAEAILGIYAGAVGEPRGNLERQLLDAFGEEPGQFVRRGLIKLVDDRCDWVVESALPPADVRDAVFAAAFAARAAGRFDRGQVLAEAAGRLGLTPAEADDALFADLKTEQRLRAIKPITPRRLLERYNVALAQSVLLKATRVEIEVAGASSARWRQLLRAVKFHRLMAEVSRAGGDAWRLTLDGPLSLFAATQKYGLQLAQFLPALLREERYRLTAELRWGPERRVKRFELTPAAGLVSHQPDRGTYVPPELAMFAEQFAKKAPAWELVAEADVLPLGPGFWAPDFRLVERATGREVYLEILGFWRKGGAERHLALLREHAGRPFVLAVSQALRVDDGDLPELANVVQFRQLPLPDAVAAAAAEALVQT
jgi:predicted nuclease of restriction endonuclease-like RecB superfamily